MRKILVVDDIVEITEIMARFLQKEGYEVYTADNGRDALELVLKHEEMPDQSFDMVITDREMPIMTGDELVRELRQHTLGLKIVVMSSLEPESDLGYDYFYRKPIDMSELMEKISDLLLL